MSQPLPIAKSSQIIHLLPQMSNRHGLIAGATGTGKTVTLQVIAENFSRIGVPVFMADVKGDLAGLSQPGVTNPRLAARIETLGIAHTFAACPVTFWDVFGAGGHPVRATISDMGPILLARLLDLNETQSGVLALVFKIADDNGLLLLDLKDLQEMLKFVGDNAKEFRTEYGNITAASIGAIQRGLVALEQQGADALFGEPALELADLMRVSADGRGMVNILAADRLFHAPKIYSTFLLWLLAELFEELPEAGDLEKPKLVFFFDEAHLLFDDAPKALVDKVEQVVRLIRSKGVGVFFITQSPLDIPEDILGQLGNRVQHALRAFTPKDQKAVRAAAQTFRANPGFDVEAAITEVGVGEALVSFLDPKGSPGMVERALIFPPSSLIGPISPQDRQALIQSSPLRGRYEQAVDRESAYELLRRRAEQRAYREEIDTLARRQPAPATRPVGRRRDTAMDTFMKGTARSVGSAVGRALIRGILGSLGGRR
ncbi:MAG TPA: helicase HerA-like domain-containing protein [bacterium]|nr:helicase HerA-like domain-containing protein [bacterium]